MPAALIWKLKAGGYPQDGQGRLVHLTWKPAHLPVDQFEAFEDQVFYEPTLSELIAYCGGFFGALRRVNYGNETSFWRASRSDSKRTFIGDTPQAAVGELALKLLNETNKGTNRSSH
jgi:hypothetical protein